MQPLRNIFGRPKKPASLGKAARRSFFASLAFHGLLLLGAGVFVISHIFYNRESTFTGQPPPSKTYEPRKIELKVKVSRQQRSSSRPSMAPRLVAARESSHLALPEIKLDSKLVTTTFQPKFKAVTGRGLGAGLGTGYGTSGFGDGVSAVNFFGIQAKGERIAILVDVSLSMVAPEEGGPLGYMRVKERVGQVVDAVKDGTLFNVIAFADACSTMEPKMVFANNEMRKKARQFIQPLNTEGNWGLSTGNYSGGDGLQAAGGTTRLDLAIAAAMKDGADTILIITDGLPEVKKVADPGQLQAYQSSLATWGQQHAPAIAAAQQAMAAFNQTMEAAPAQKVWIPPTPARPPANRGGPPREGQQPDNGAPATPGHWEVVHNAPAGMARPAMPAPPPPPDPGMWKLSDFIQHITLLHEAFYKAKGLKPPVIDCIGYQVDREGSVFLQQLASNYKGQYRLVRSMK